MGSKVTIDQVAAICGVSKTTISRYLNHKYENISAETRQRIEQVIAELDYRPNRTAQRLKASRSMLIGCCIGERHREPLCGAAAQGNYRDLRERRISGPVCRQQGKRPVGAEGH